MRSEGGFNPPRACALKTQEVVFKAVVKMRTGKDYDSKEV